MTNKFYSWNTNAFCKLWFTKTLKGDFPVCVKAREQLSSIIVKDGMKK